jgi:catechol 2,3-dioxygenase-like lactoylglutathione lyase family enzyme
MDPRMREDDDRGVIVKVDKMTKCRLDHVNIRTACLPESIAFYRDALGLTLVPPPMQTDMSRGAYAQDDEGMPIVHLVAADAVADAPGPMRGKAMRGMVDHFALRRDDHDACEARLTQCGLSFDKMTVPEIASRLIFLRDPNEVMVELSFPIDEVGEP